MNYTHEYGAVLWLARASYVRLFFILERLWLNVSTDEFGTYIQPMIPGYM